MKKKAESGDAGKGTRKVSGPDKGPRLIPSRTWGQGARALWRSLAFRERSLIVMGIFVPALDQISRLGSLGVTMKAVGMGIREPLDFDMRLWLGLIILGATGITALIQIFSGRVKRGLKVQFTRMVRRIYAGMVVETARLPLGERESEIESLLDEERNFMNSATSGIAALLEFISAVFLVIVLLVILTWFNWIVGAIILGSGLVALVILRFKIKSAPRKENDKLGEAREKLSQRLESLAGKGRDAGVLIEDYADNQFDKLTFAELDAKTSLQKKISSAMNFGSAILMAIVFFLVSAEGAFDENKVVWMVVFIFGLRMVVSHGKTAMVKWGSVLGEKKTLMAMARAAVNSSTNAAEYSGRDGDPVGNAIGGPTEGARIVDYSFRGLRGMEIVSREPLVLEMTVESDAEIKGFYWSFSLSPEASSLVLISKTSEDCGITWDLPAGRSRFRMVSGPVWLPEGTYAARVGIAKGNRLLDLIGKKGVEASISVLPDEAAKHSVQTRFSNDAVVMDVTWELEFRQEESQTGESVTNSSETILENQ